MCIGAPNCLCTLWCLYRDHSKRRMDGSTTLMCVCRVCNNNLRKIVNTQLQWQGLEWYAILRTWVQTKKKYGENIPFHSQYMSAWWIKQSETVTEPLTKCRQCNSQTAEWVYLSNSNANLLFQCNQTTFICLSMFFCEAECRILRAWCRENNLNALSPSHFSLASDCHRMQIRNG